MLTPRLVSPALSSDQNAPQIKGNVMTGSGALDAEASNPRVVPCSRAQSSWDVEVGSYNCSATRSLMCFVPVIQLGNTYLEKTHAN